MSNLPHTSKLGSGMDLYNQRDANASRYFQTYLRQPCGKIGIRTLETVTRLPHFECGAIDHSAIFPIEIKKRLILLRPITGCKKLRFSFRSAKVLLFSELCKFFSCFLHFSSQIHLSRPSIRAGVLLNDTFCARKFAYPKFLLYLCIKFSSYGILWLQ